MAKFWFISAPLFSHLDWGGFLKTAQVLKHRGHDVTWVSGEPIRNPVESSGLAFAPIAETGWLWPPPPQPDVSQMNPQDAVMLRYVRALDTWMTEDLVRLATQHIIDLVAEIGKPDAIVTDAFLTAAALAAEALDVPLAVAGWLATADMNEEHLFPVQKRLSEESIQRISSLYAHFGLQGVNFSHGATPSIISPHLHISYFTPGWYLADTAAMLEQNAFVGGKPATTRQPEPDWLQAIPAEKPLALITLGSTFTGDLGFFSWAAHAAHRVGLIPIVVIGTNPIDPADKQELIAALPKTTRLLNWVNLAHVLPRCKLVIQHGGMGTTHAVLTHGIPQMVVPHAADQRGQAKRVAEAKVGLNLSAHDVRNGKLLEGARALIKDERVQQTARDFAAEMASLGGPPAAADLLEEMISGA
ncbi:MAG: glycosyltransferase [Chloroflexota bacterium]